jgi:hypothetical protein
MRLAASGASVAVKRRAVEPVNKVKILPAEFVSLDVSQERIGSHRSATNLPFRARVGSSDRRLISRYRLHLCHNIRNQFCVKHLFGSDLLRLLFLSRMSMCLLGVKHLGVTYFSIFCLHACARNSRLLTQHASAVRSCNLEEQCASFFIQTYF